MEHRSITEKAYAKLNLTLDVVGLLPNGYHEMLMVMQSVSLWDDVTVTTAPGIGKISVTTNRSYLPNNEKNLGYVAAKKYMEACGVEDSDVMLKLHKRIPVCAGMGGGSSDAAAVLRAMNALNGGRLTVKELETLSESIGSDVAFCVAGGTALAKGTGTELVPVAPMPDCGIAIIKPRFSVSTPKLFAALDSVRVNMHPDTDGLLKAIPDGDLPNVARRCFNIFESILPTKEADIVNGAKAALLNEGALGACMTGTGSAVFGLFSAVNDARRACDALSKNYQECFWARPVKRLFADNFE